MKQIFVVLILSILIFHICNMIINRRKKLKYLKAGKKWDNIVKELSKRK